MVDLWITTVVGYGDWNLSFNSMERITGPKKLWKRQGNPPWTWDVMFMPSPELEIIRLQVRENEVLYLRMLTDSVRRPSILAGTASTLREFSIEKVPQGWFSPQAPWLSQLHSLVLSTPSALNATDVLVAQTRTLTLEHLDLRNILPRIKEQLALVSFPRLRVLNISKAFTT
ncbi:hypothetical protein CVT25_009104 [Psilocybe cyanescens]|uniref:Uncharacterized protein n=1 Tax=Psilocybe cyanescens TaxID=93625 RepID=A0A409VNG8_PSICY|nr:hypothetical protein CVT25_009104 [Psilocybe cyanescens]